jgi:hypothetical protein
VDAIPVAETDTNSMSALPPTFLEPRTPDPSGAKDVGQTPPSGDGSLRIA